MTVQDVTPEVAATLGLSPASGAVVEAIEPGSPAAAAGLRRGDVILTVNGRPITGSSELRYRIGLLRLGSPLELTVLRDGQTRTVTAAAGA